VSYRFNGGRGAAVCDKCNVIIDEDLSWDEYQECYPEPTHCMNCKQKRKDKEVKVKHQGTKVP